MSTHQLAQWKPGDLFAIKPTQFRRFYRNLPFAGNQEGSVTSTTVNLDLFYIVTAVYEELTWTAIKFHNQHAVAVLRDPVRPGNAEPLWTIARDMDHNFCHRISIRTGLLKPNYWEHIIHHPYINNVLNVSSSRSRSRST